MSLRAYLAYFLTIAALLVAAPTHAKPTRAPRPVVQEQVYVDSAFTDSELAKVRAALDEWNIAAGTSIRYTVAGRFPHADAQKAIDLAHSQPNLIVVVKEAADAEDWANIAAGKPVRVAHVESIPGRVVAVMDFGVETPGLVGVLIHEFGHIQGLVHLPVRTSVMYPVAGDQACIDTTTLLEFAVLRPELDWSGWVVTCDEG